ncbi:hypothetical protein ABEO98_23575 [Brevibacillus parabrevis]|uniref:hypothetical protein n=1 Tax=Brevibacillus parabrevis TaxID=54914 RepID=UPI002E1CEFF8|nr:hypothetical protein [Brevibacillus parabrevis]
MRVATGLLLALWLLFMGFQFFTTKPVGYDGELMHFISGFLIFIQLIAWVFVFTMPFVSFVTLLLATILAVLLAVGMDSVYFLFAGVNTVFVLMIYAGHRELSKKVKSKTTKTT